MNLCSLDELPQKHLKLLFDPYSQPECFTWQDINHYWTQQPKWKLLHSTQRVYRLIYRVGYITNRVRLALAALYGDGCVCVVSLGTVWVEPGGREVHNPRQGTLYDLKRNDDGGK